MQPESGHVLVVDDNEMNRQLLVRRLRRQGHSSKVAENGREALEWLRTEPFDLVLLDIMMPEMDGYETLATIQEDDNLRHVPVIMISAVDDLDSVVRCIEMGAADYLPKPFNPILLKARVTASLEKKRLRDQEQMEARLLQRDLDIGREIQTGFFPDELPQPQGWRVAAHFRAARQVAGDFYDAFQMGGKEQIGLVIADVCDKGVGAALFMALFRTLLRAIADQAFALGNDAPEPQGAGPPGLLNAIRLTNDYIARTHGSANMFATIFFAVLEPATGHLYYVNAGHEMPLLLRAEGNIERLQPTGPAVGMLPDMSFTVASTTLAPGDLLLTFTDGVTEAMDADRRVYSDERLRNFVRSRPASAPQHLLEELALDIAAHIGDAPQSDDITLLAVRGETLPAG